MEVFEANIWLLVAIGGAAGFIGSLLGVGGGFLIIPVLALAFHLPMQVAIGTSLIGVVATSSMASVNYLRSGLTNIRLAMLLEVATTAGAIIGAVVAVWLSPSLLSALFGSLAVYMSYSMARRPGEQRAREGCTTVQGRLDGSYYDEKQGRVMYYHVRRTPYGMVASALAGMLSGLLGIGGGIVKVPVMNLVMGIPVKPAIGTSSLMIGITAVASAFIYFNAGYVYPFLAAPIVVGILFGAWLGPRVLGQAGSLALRRTFAGIMLVVALMMFLKAGGILF